jgi:hypothetical protein
MGHCRAGALCSREVQHAGPGLDCARAPVHAFSNEPLRLYSAACHFGWAEDTCPASTHSLSVNLYDPKNCPALFELHHERCKQFPQCIAESPFLTDVQLTDVARCSRCYNSIPYVEWHELQNVVLAELETCPSGDTVLAGLEVWLAAQVYWVQQVLPTRFG